MTARLAGLVRHPIKGLGREPLPQADLTAGAPMPGDRAWALLHAGAAEDGAAWQPRRNFVVVASGPRLAQVTARTDGDRIALSHPDCPDLTLNPATDGAALIEWVTPLWPAERPAPRRLVRAPPQGMADNAAAQVSVINLASLRALSQRLGQTLEVARFRGNLILDGLAPWEEFDWIGRTIEIGAVTLDVTDRIARCRATEASPRTGRRDVSHARDARGGLGPPRLRCLRNDCRRRSLVPG